MSATGVKFEVKVSDGPALAALKNLDEKLVKAALLNVGEVLLNSTRKRFNEQKDPDGQAWAPLNPAYAQTKRGNKILQGSGMRGGLLGSITYQVSGTRLTIGTNKIYGAIHQFGGVIVPRNGNALVFRLGGHLVKVKKVTIPRRAFLGVSAADGSAIDEAVDEAVEILSK